MMANNALAPPVYNALASFAQPPTMVDPMDFSDKYNTPLKPAEKKEYQKWLMTLPEYQRNARDYDLQGAFKAGLNPAENGHFPDAFKKPNHPTFSDQSKYSGVEGHVGGSWSKLANGQWAFTPGVSKVREPMWSPEDLKAYFSRVEPNNILVMP
jgi:hypothetical protein